MGETRRKPGRPARGYATSSHTPDYTPEEFEFIRAIEAYKQSKQRPYPTCREILAVLLALGYRKG